LLFAVLIILSLVGASHGEAGSGIENDYAPKEDGWRFMVSPYALLASQSTDVGGTQLRQSFNDLYSLTNFGFQLVASVMYRNWILTADGTYADLGASDDESLLWLDLDVKQTILDLRLGYLMLNRVDHEDQSEVVRGWNLEVNAGAKYWRNDVTLDYAFTLGDAPPLVEGRLETVQSWWDPMIGARARIILSRTVLLGIHVSGGGLGIGGASEFSWDFLYTNTFKVSRLFSVTAGFRFFAYRYVEGEGDSELETRVSVYGPLLGVSLVL
jgi:hypothetical protein